MKTTFTNQCTGAEFVARNAELSVYPTKSGHLAFSGTTDNRGYISDEAGDILRAEMSKPGADLKSAIALLAFSVCHTEDGDEIPMLHKVPQRAATLWSY